MSRLRDIADTLRSVVVVAAWVPVVYAVVQMFRAAFLDDAEMYLRGWTLFLLSGGVALVLSWTLE